MCLTLLRYRPIVFTYAMSPSSQGEDRFGGVRDGKELRRRDVHALVGRLGGEHHGDEEFEGSGKMEFRLRIRMLRGEAPHEFLPIGLADHFFSPFFFLG